MKRKLTGSVVALAVVASATGCASIRVKTPTVQDEAARTDRAEVVTTGASATMQLHGTTLDLAAAHSCDLVEHPIVNRTTTTERENDTAWADWTLGVAGLALIGGGVYTTIDASNVYGTSTTSKNYNPIGNGGATAIGIGEMVAGVGLGAVAIYDVIRANKITVETKEAQLGAHTIKEGIRCSSGAPYANAPVDGEVNGRAYALGNTDNDGKLHVDVDPIVKAALAKEAHFRMKVARIDVGDLDLDPVYLAQEARAWTDAHVDNCRNPTSDGSCVGLAALVSTYPDGPHAGEARRVLEQARPAIQTFAEASAWSQLDVEACAKRPSDDPVVIDDACQQLRAFLARFPDGAHSKDANAAVKAGEGRAAALREKSDRQQKEGARKEDAAQRAKCEGGCRLQCSSVLFSNFGTCYSGCLQVRCTK